jgi:hypothetical protein
VLKAFADETVDGVPIINNPVDETFGTPKGAESESFFDAVSFQPESAFKGPNPLDAYLQFTDTTEYAAAEPTAFEDTTAPVQAESEPVAQTFAPVEVVEETQPAVVEATAAPKVRTFSRIRTSWGKKVKYEASAEPVCDHHTQNSTSKEQPGAGQG